MIRIAKEETAMARLFLLALCVIISVPVPSSCRTWYVKPDSTGDAPTIQDAVDLSAYYSSLDPVPVADTVLVAAGT